jgi:hypothetical protein
MSQHRNKEEGGGMKEEGGRMRDEWETGREERLGIENRVEMNSKVENGDKDSI